MKKLENIAKYVAIDELKQLENNPRQIKKADFERLKESVKKNDKFFEAHPIIASDRTGENVIIAGNMRWKAAKELRMEKCRKTSSLLMWLTYLKNSIKGEILLIRMKKY